MSSSSDPATHYKTPATRCNTLQHAKERREYLINILIIKREQDATIRDTVLGFSEFPHDRLAFFLGKPKDDEPRHNIRLIFGSCGCSVVTSSYILVLELGINDKPLRPSWSRYFRSLSLLIPREPSCACVCVRERESERENESDLKYNLLHLEGHFFILKTQSLVSFSRSLLHSFIIKRSTRLGLEIKIE